MMVRQIGEEEEEMMLKVIVLMPVGKQIVEKAVSKFRQKYLVMMLNFIQLHRNFHKFYGGEY
jgi:hypothetical protein